MQEELIMWVGHGGCGGGGGHGGGGSGPWLIVHAPHMEPNAEACKKELHIFLHSFGLQQ